MENGNDVEAQQDKRATTLVTVLKAASLSVPTAKITAQSEIKFRDKSSYLSNMYYCEFQIHKQFFNREQANQWRKRIFHRKYNTAKKEIHIYD